MCDHGSTLQGLKNGLESTGRVNTELLLVKLGSFDQKPSYAVTALMPLDKARQTPNLGARELRGTANMLNLVAIPVSVALMIVAPVTLNRFSRQLQRFDNDVSIIDTRQQWSRQLCSQREQ